MAGWPIEGEYFAILIRVGVHNLIIKSFGEITETDVSYICLILCLVVSTRELMQFLGPEGRRISCRW